jgi:hypothetical protein
MIALLECHAAQLSVPCIPAGEEIPGEGVAFLVAASFFVL